jgi:hypothetical protein
MKQCVRCQKYKNKFEFYKDKYNKDNLTSKCKVCMDYLKKKFVEDNPWYAHLFQIRRRCNKKDCPAYIYYGFRGIKCLITLSELKILWFRDKAYLMKKPNISRKDNDGNYCFDNCEFIEKGLNTIERNIRVLSKPVLQYDKQMNFIKEYSSLTKTANELNLQKSNISGVCLGKYGCKTAGGFIFRFK